MTTYPQITASTDDDGRTYVSLRTNAETEFTFSGFAESELDMDRDVIDIGYDAKGHRMSVPGATEYTFTLRMKCTPPTATHIPEQAEEDE